MGSGKSENEQGGRVCPGEPVSANQMREVYCTHVALCFAHLFFHIGHNAVRLLPPDHEHTPWPAKKDAVSPPQPVSAKKLCEVYCATCCARFRSFCFAHRAQTQLPSSLPTTVNGQQIQPAAKETFCIDAQSTSSATTPPPCILYACIACRFTSSAPARERHRRHHVAGPRRRGHRL